MKRETKEWTRRQVALEVAEHFDNRRGGGDGVDDLFMRGVSRLLDSDARLRAELRRKDKEIRRIAAFIETARSGQLPPSPGAVLHQARSWLLAALKKPRNGRTKR